METIKEQLKIAIEKQRQLLWPTNTGEMKVVDTPTAVVQGWLNALRWMDKLLDSQPKEEVSEDLKAEVQRWRDHYMAVKEHGFQIDLRDIETVAYHFAQWQKELMLKGAVEEEVKFSDLDDRKYVLVPYDDYNQGDKVKLAIIKED